MRWINHESLIKTTKWNLFEALHKLNALSIDLSYRLKRTLMFVHALHAFFSSSLWINYSWINDGTTEWFFYLLPTNWMMLYSNIHQSQFHLNLSCICRHIVQQNNQNLSISNGWISDKKNNMTCSAPVFP